MVLLYKQLPICINSGLWLGKFSVIKAHEAYDKAVMEAYKVNVKTTSESDCVSFLMNLHKELTANTNS